MVESPRTWYIFLNVHVKAQPGLLKQLAAGPLSIIMAFLANLLKEFLKLVHTAHTLVITKILGRQNLSYLLMLAMFLHSAQVVTDLRASGFLNPPYLYSQRLWVFFIITDLVEAAVNLKQLIQ